MRSVVCVLALVAYVYAQSYNARLLAKDYNTGATLGYVRPSAGTPGLYHFYEVTDQNSHLVVTVTEGVSQSNFPTVANSRGFPYFGFNIYDSILSTSSSALVIATGVNQTPPGSMPIGVGSDYYNYPAESAVWYVDPITKEISATWINTDGSSAALEFADQLSNVLFATGSYYFMSLTYGSTVRVKLFAEAFGAPPTQDLSTCGQFDLNTYGAKKPTITTSASGSTITINVAMPRQDFNNDVNPIFHDIDTKPATSNVCHTSANNIQDSAGTAWTKATTSCTDTYTVTQSLNDIISSSSNNNWVKTLSADGRTITYTLPIYATYSVNTLSGNNAGCYYVGFKSVISFQTKLSVASTSTDFVTADKSARFAFSGLRITSANDLEIQGTIYPLVPNSVLQDITLKKTVGQYQFTSSASTCGNANGCAQTYTIAIPTLQASGNDISGQYDTTMGLYENSVQTRAVTLSYELNFIIPTDPSVVDSDTITTGNTLYTDNTYTTPRTASYQTAVSTLYIKNQITSSVAIPANYRLRMTEGYVCCVNYLSSISAYNPATGQGGCKDPTGKVEHVALGSDTTHPNLAAFYPADATTPKSYRMEVQLSSVFTNTPHTQPLTCEVLLISKLEADGGARRSQGGSIIGDLTYAKPFVSTSQLLVESPKVISGSSSLTFVLAFVVVAVTLLL